MFEEAISYSAYHYTARIILSVVVLLQKWRGRNLQGLFQFVQGLCMQTMALSAVLKIAASLPSHIILDELMRCHW